MIDLARRPSFLRRQRTTPVPWIMVGPIAVVAVALAAPVAILALRFMAAVR